MGGRGSAYETLVKKTNEISQIQEEDYSFEINKGNFDDPESEKRDNVFLTLKVNGVSTRKSTDNVNNSSLLINQTKLIYLTSKYKNIINERLEDIQLGCDNLGRDVSGLTSVKYEASGVKIRIALNKDELNNPQLARIRQNENIQKNYHAPINIRENSSKYTITHEMGHCIESCIFSKMRKNNPNLNKISNKELATKIRSEVEKIYKNCYAKPNENIIMNISQYSRTNSCEWFAETFTNLELSKEPTSVAKALNDFIRRYI